jgi:hypothetical protein
MREVVFKGGSPFETRRIPLAIQMSAGDRSTKRPRRECLCTVFGDSVEESEINTQTQETGQGQFDEKSSADGKAGEETLSNRRKAAARQDPEHVRLSSATFPTARQAGEPGVRDDGILADG